MIIAQQKVRRKRRKVSAAAKTKNALHTDSDGDAQPGSLPSTLPGPLPSSLPGNPYSAQTGKSPFNQPGTTPLAQLGTPAQRVAPKADK